MFHDMRVTYSTNGYRSGLMVRCGEYLLPLLDAARRNSQDAAMDLNFYYGGRGRPYPWGIISVNANGT